MYYKIFDEETQSYVPSVYNAEDRKEIKVAMEWLLKGDLSYDDVTEVSKLKWDQYVVKLKEYGFIVSQQPTPFDTIDIENGVAWEDYMEDTDNDFLDNEDNDNY
jgi:hypothetical protein